MMQADTDGLSGISHLLEQAAHNERILRRYQAFELELLAAEGFVGVLEILLERAPQHFKLDAVEIWLLDHEGLLRNLIADSELSFQGLCWLDSPQTLYSLYGASASVQLRSIDDGRPILDLFPGRRIRSVAALPLQRQGQLIGSLHFGSFSGQRFTDDKSSDFIEHLSSIVALCLENAVNQERLRHLSLIDVLTRIQNRRAFDQALTLEPARASRTGKSLSLLLIQLEQFGRVIEDHGPVTGDRVLVAVAQEMAGMLRKTDHVCRCASETFALLLPDCERNLAMDIAGRVRERLLGLRIASDSGIPVGVSLAIGATGWQASEGAQPPGLARDLVATATRAMDTAREAGRDQSAYIACPPG